MRGSSHLPQAFLKYVLNYVEKKFMKISSLGLSYGYQDIQDHGGEEGGYVFGHGFLTMRPIEL